MDVEICGMFPALHWDHGTRWSRQDMSGRSSRPAFTWSLHEVVQSDAIGGMEGRHGSSALVGRDGGAKVEDSPCGCYSCFGLRRIAFLGFAGSECLACSKDLATGPFAICTCCFIKQLSLAEGHGL